MSTKIYYGQKLNAKTFPEVQEIIKNLKERHSAYVTGFLKDIDGEKAKNKITDLIDVAKEFDVDLAINYDQVTDAWYMIPLGMYGPVEDLVKLPGLIEYGYWNNTDPLEDVSDEEWDERAELWNRLLPGFETIGEQMFCISLKFNVFPFLTKKIKEIK